MLVVVEKNVKYFISNPKKSKSKYSLKFGFPKRMVGLFEILLKVRLTIYSVILTFVVVQKKSHDTFYCTRHETWDISSKYW